MLCAYATTFVPVPAEEVYAYLIRFEDFPIYDEKAAKVRVLGLDAQGRTEMEIGGRFGFIPYAALFRATLNPGRGYTTEMVSGAFLWAKAQYWVRPVDGGCEVTHMEEYQLGFGWFGQLIEEAWRPYVQGTVEREVLTLKQLIQDGHHRTMPVTQAATTASPA